MEKILKNNVNLNTIRRKTFIVEKFINFLIIIRLYLTEIPLWIWALILIILYGLKVRREGNIPSSIFVILAMICSVLGEYLKIDFIFLMAPILAGVSHFLSYKIYWFPKIPGPVGMRQEVLQNDLYMMQLYPIQKNENIKKRPIFWNHRLQLSKMMEHDKAKNPIYQIFFKFFISAVSKTKIILAQGDQEITNQTIVFSHGRTATPLMQSQLLLQLVFMGNKFNLVAPQHTEQMLTGETQSAKIKRYRQIQVQSRAAQMYSTLEHCKNKNKFVMMGHSYGGSTTVQTYHSLPDNLKEKVSHMILLDPWLYPLTSNKLVQQIKCPVLILANEYFVENEDVYNRNRDFVNGQKKDKVIYLMWKKGDHLHQTDFGFILGNTFNKVKHSELSLQMLNNNVEAIKIFLSQKNVSEIRMREIFEKDVLPFDYKPDKWNNYLSL